MKLSIKITELMKVKPQMQIHELINPEVDCQEYLAAGSALHWTEISVFVTTTNQLNNGEYLSLGEHCRHCTTIWWNLQTACNVQRAMESVINVTSQPRTATDKKI